jgi:acyl carrier protein
MFCGEALPISLARDWSIAAPNSSIENWYGPTEATIACSRYVLTQFSDRPNTGSDLVAIGSGFTNMQLSVHDSNLQSVKSGIPGELLLSGPQICTGYLDEPVKTATSFVILPDRTSVAYRTGDRVVQDDQGQIHFLGRIDNQVKIRGYRVELGEIEAILRKASGGLNAVALPWPPNSSSGQVIIGALETGHPQDGPSIISYMSELLPDYMVPVDIISLNSFPKNASGKVDRKLLSNQLQTLHDEKISISAETELNQGEQQLLASIVHVSPHLQPRRILDAPTLIAAGMDSLSFISLTAEIERIYEVELGQDDVVSLSLLPFGQIVGYIESLSKSSRVSDSGSSKRLRGIMERLSNFRVDLGLIKPRSRTIDYRANRILQFVDSFPKLLSSCDKELVIAIGSSGVFRGISPKEIEHEAARLGRPITCINAGFPAINLGSIKLICDYVRQCCEEQNVRVPAILYELDPMHISTLPPRRELRITKDYFSGRIKSDRNAHYGTEFEWSTQHRGEWLYNANASRRKRQPDWERKRDMEVALTYLGNIRFRRTELKQWIAGAELLSRITGRVICFIHPANNAMLQTVETERRGECFDQLLHIIANQHKIEVLPWKSFELDDNDFLDINHVHPMTGRAKLSQQLAHYLFDLKHGY